MSKCLNLFFFPKTNTNSHEIMKTTLFSILIILSFNAFATNWKKVYENPMGNSFVDIDNIIKRNNVVSYQGLFNYRETSPIGVNSSINNFTVDCIGEKITWLSSKYYSQSMGEGEIIKEGKFNRRLFPRPDSVDYITMKFVCNYKQLNT